MNPIRNRPNGGKLALIVGNDRFSDRNGLAAKNPGAIVVDLSIKDNHENPAAAGNCDSRLAKGDPPVFVPTIVNR